MHGNSLHRYMWSAAALLCSLLFVCNPALGETAKGKGTKVTPREEEPSDNVPSLQLSEGISERIYAQTTSELTSRSTHAVTLDSSLRLFFPREFVLRNNYFTVPYSTPASKLPGFMIGPQIPLTNIGEAQLRSRLQLGYAYTQGILSAESESGLTVQDAIELQWIPLQAGIEVMSGTLTAQRVKLGVSSSCGMDWYTQSGQLDGMSQTYWVPRYEAGGTVALFTQDNSVSGGFDGIRISALYYQTFSSKQVNHGWVADVGAQYAF